jgi:hypothetical protein
MSKGRGFAEENNQQDKSKDSCNDVGNPEAFDFSRLFRNLSICHCFAVLAQQQVGFSRKLKVLHFCNEISTCDASQSLGRCARGLSK